VSDIVGSGYGSAHDWCRCITDTFSGEEGTRYFCRRCGAVFVHLYDLVPDIFAHMEMYGVSEQCPEVAS
jgi:hypothetical protein